MKPTAECVECARWWSDYEAATMEEFRAHSRLQIARYSHQWDAVPQLEAEAVSVTQRRDQLRKALVIHQKSHPRPDAPAIAA